ncbi:hypothetical protein B0H13DRAFT_2334998 [Mycena leptocephala]|nr:hypothetical protein B0H13DRAFT_2334998 [Mycena leptocephala]
MARPPSPPHLTICERATRAFSLCQDLFRSTLEVFENVLRDSKNIHATVLVGVRQIDSQVNPHHYRQRQGRLSKEIDRMPASFSFLFPRSRSDSNCPSSPPPRVERSVGTSTTLSCTARFPSSSAPFVGRPNYQVSQNQALPLCPALLLSSPRLETRNPSSSSSSGRVRAFARRMDMSMDRRPEVEEGAGEKATKAPLTRENGASCVTAHEKPVHTSKKVAPATLCA